jgi:hypothetical protein
MSKDKPSPKKPPKVPIKNVQYNLFTTFLTNDEGAVSNAIELWDGIPKYFLTTKQQEKLRTHEGLAQSYSWEYSYQGKSFKVRIQPALITQKDGRDKAFFPSVTEEIVEEALKKILTDQQYGMHDPTKSESWVKFSLGMLYKELKERGKARSRAEIKHAITVLSRCILTFCQGGKEIYSGPILSDLITVNRERYLADTDSYHAARLPVFVSHGINRLQYRQFNYARLMDCNEQLTRWLYKRLVHRYRHASLIESYHFLFSEVKQSSGLLQQATDRRNRKKLLSALDELKGKNVLFRYTAEEIKGGRKVADVKYIVTAAPEFIGEQKAANKRDRQNFDKARHLRVVDKFD